METQIEDIISEYLDLLNEGGAVPSADTFLSSYGDLSPDMRTGLRKTLVALQTLRLQPDTATRQTEGWQTLDALITTESAELIASAEPEVVALPTPILPSSKPAQREQASRRWGWRPVFVGLGLAAAIVLVLVISISTRSNNAAVVSATDDPYTILRRVAQANLAVPQGKVRHLIYQYNQIGGSYASSTVPMPWKEELWLSYDGNKPLMRGQNSAIDYLALMDQNYYWLRDPLKGSVERYPADPGIVTAFANSLNPIRLMLSLPDLRVAGADVVNSRSTILVDRITASPPVGSTDTNIIDFRLWVDPQTLEVVQVQRIIKEVAFGSFTNNVSTGTDTLVLDEVKDRDQFPSDLFTFHVPEGMKVNEMGALDLGSDPILDPTRTPAAVAANVSPTPGEANQSAAATPIANAPVPRMTLNQFKIMYDDPYLRPLVVDVRSPEAFNQGHIAGAVSLPEAEVESRVKDLPRDKLIVLYDNSPGEAVAARIAVKLHSQDLFDYQLLKVLEGGWSAWKQAGVGNTAYPVETGATLLPTRTPDAWADLRTRPLNLPTTSGGACPVSASQKRLDNMPPLLGKGPVHPSGFYSFDGTALYLPAAPDANGLYDTKIIWLGDTGYDGGPVLVRGRQLDGSGVIRFQLNVSDPVSDELLLNSDNTSYSPSVPSGWYTWPTAVYLPGRGCYAVQIDGAAFSETLTFEAK